MGKLSSATLIDIARVCDVNISTVSRALNDDPRVRVDTKDRISKVAKRLGYRPNLAARMLRAKKSRFFWFIAPDLGNSFDCDMVEKAALAAAQDKYDLIVSLHLGQQKIFDRIMTAMHSGLAGGAIVNRRDINDLTVLHGLVKQNFPVVLVDVPIDSMNLPVVTTDHKKATYDLVKACLKAGAKSFLVLFDPTFNLVDRRRFESALSALHELGVPYLTAPQVLAGRAISKLPGPVAVIESHQHTIQPFVDSHAELSGMDLIYGCYDQWIGSVHPAKKVLVAEQDCESLARTTVKSLIHLLEGGTHATLPSETDLPLLSLKELS